jgi:hypothetical protein
MHLFSCYEISHWNTACIHTSCTVFLCSIHCSTCLLHLQTAEPHVKNKTWKYKNLTVIHIVTVLSYIFHAGWSPFVIEISSSIQCRLQYLSSAIYAILKHRSHIAPLKKKHVLDLNFLQLWYTKTMPNSYNTLFYRPTYLIYYDTLFYSALLSLS